MDKRTDGNHETTGPVEGRDGNAEGVPQFRHERIDSDPPSGRLFLCLTTDLTGNGRPDLVVGGTGSEEIDTPIPGLSVDRGTIQGYLSTRFETDIFWYENPGWERHAMTDTPNRWLLGGTLVDFEGDGRTDIAVGQAYGRNNIYWFEQPANPREPWPHRVVRSDFEKYHDLAFGDVDDDGEPELVGLSQGDETVFYYDIPDDPRATPWPDSTLHIVDDDVMVEGLTLTDIDDDGTTEIVAGPYIYHRRATGWRRETVAEGWEWTRLGVADLDGDGESELVLAEGDASSLGDRPSRVSWFDPPDWTEHPLRTDLFNPHTLEVADFTDNGRPDIYVAEMGLEENEEPRHLLFRNEGGQFTEHVVAVGATHEARAVDLTGNGRLDIIGKSYTPDPHVDVWYNEGPPLDG